MKLSEAIRLGSTMNEQCRNNYRIDTTAILMGEAIASVSTRTCALGAALAAIGELPKSEYLDEADGCVLRSFPLTNRDLEIVCPTCGNLSSSVFNAIVHLNDSCLWTRGEIADWVEQIERTIEETEKVTAPEEVAVAV